MAPDVRNWSLPAGLAKPNVDGTLAAVARSPCVPGELTKRPFSLEEARKAGLTLSALRGRAWRRLGYEIYCWTELPVDHWLLLSAWRRALPSAAVFAGATAAYLHGLDLEPTRPVEIQAPPDSGIRSRPGLDVRRCLMPPGEIVTVRGLDATTLHGTLIDLCVRRPPVEALVVIDMAVRSGLTNPVTLGRYAESADGRPGAGRLRSLAELAAPAESPMETRLRWLLIQAGLPRPEVQVDLRDRDGRFVGRADLYYPTKRLVLEYDGGNHRDRLVEDDRRQNLLLNAGFRLLRFTAADVHRRPEVVTGQVREALALSQITRFDRRAE